MFDVTSVSTEVINMIVGKMLGDGCITKQPGRKPRFQFIHSINDKEWCFYCYEKLKTSIPLPPPRYKKVLDKRIKKGFTECFQVQSRTHPFITWLESIWYTNRIKTIPFDFLEVYFNQLTLAWWYQDDGHLAIKNQIQKKVILSTDYFRKEENLRLIELLTRKFRLFFKLDSQNRLILYDQLQIYYFLRLIQPYVHESMGRKLAPIKDSKGNSKRTTIYLPINIHLTKPTVEINQQLNKLSTLYEIVIDRTKYIEFYRNKLYYFQLNVATKGYQIVINEQDFTLLHSIKNQTGLTMSQIITICFEIAEYTLNNYY